MKQEKPFIKRFQIEELFGIYNVDIPFEDDINIFVGENGLDTSLVKYEEHIDVPFPNGESLKGVENRVRNFCNYLLENYNGKTIALVAHKAPQLALEVITKNITWDEAIDKDWRKAKAWQPGWIYEIGEKQCNHY